MPIYEYQCGKCKKVTTSIQKINDLPITICEHCAAEGKMVKIISNCSFTLKGAGWYATDYKGK